MAGSSSPMLSCGRTLWRWGLVMLGVALVAAPAGAAKKGVTVPGAPTITAVTAGIHQVKVEFTAPTNNGGARVQSYRVKCTSSDGGKKGSRTGKKSPILVIDLNGNKTYTCVVVARNLAGHSPPSAPSNPATVLTH